MSNSSEVDLFIEARNHVHHTIHEWYPGDLIVARPESTNHALHGTASARVFAWSQIATGLATHLNDLGTQLDDDYQYEQIIDVARHHISNAAKQLWPNAHHFTSPLHPQLSIAEEFEVYRIGANILAAQLASLSERCLALAFLPENPQLPAPHSDTNGRS